MKKTFNAEQKAWNNLMKMLNNSHLHETNNSLYEDIAYELDVIGKILFEENENDYNKT